MKPAGAPPKLALAIGMVAEPGDCGRPRRVSCQLDRSLLVTGGHTRRPAWHGSDRLPATIATREDEGEDQTSLTTCP